MPRARLLPAGTTEGVWPALQGVHPPRRRGPLTLQALQAGDIAVALLFTTDPNISAQHLVVLADDRAFHPAENITPVVRRDVVARYGTRMPTLINAVSARLTTAPCVSQRAGCAGRRRPSFGGRGLAARTRADVDRGCCSLSEDIEPVATRDGPASLPPGTAVHKTRRQRRPTGAPPPLPHPITISMTAWLILGAVVLAAAFVAAQHTPWLRVDDRVSTWMLRQLAAIRTPWLTDVAKGINAAGSGWGATVLGLSVVALLMVFRRWRHLLVFIGIVLFLEQIGTLIYNGLSRPRPYGVQIIASWTGYASASPPVAVLTIFLMGVVYCLAVPGRPRSYTKAAVVAVVALFSLARLYLGVDHPGDVLLGATFAVAIAVTAFRFFTPNEAFPVVYRRGRSAHVDVTGQRGAAIRQAVRDQLGLNVAEIKPVGLESSAG